MAKISSSPSQQYSPETPSTTSFNPDDYLLNMVRRAVSNRQNIKITHTDSGESIVVLPIEGEYYSNVRDTSEFCSHEKNQYSVMPATSNILAEYNIDEVLGRNIDELLWIASYSVSNGRLIDECNPLDIIEFIYWPNLTRLPGPDCVMHIAAIFTRYPTTVALVKNILNIPFNDLFDTYSAAYCAGWTRIHNRVIEPPVLEPHKDRSVLGMLLNRIAGM